MTFGLTPTGFNPKTSAVIRDELATDQIAAIGPLWNARNLALVGVFNSIFATQMGAIWEGLAQIHGQFDPDAAEGEGLDSVGALRGTLRRPQRRSVVVCNCLMVPATTVTPGAMVAHVVGDPNRRFRNSFGFTVPGSGLVGVTVPVQFEAEEFGPIEAPATLLAIPDTTVAGWLGSIVNPTDATLGDGVESDEAYRLRQTEDLAAGGSATQPALIAALAAVADVSSVAVLSNDTDVTVDTIPPHSMECVVSGGDPATIAQTIFNEKAPGDGTSGNQSNEVEAPDGLSHVINWTRPTLVPIWLYLNVRVTSEFPGTPALAAFLAAWANGAHAPGGDVVPSRIGAKSFEVAGVYDVTVAWAGFSALVLSSAIHPIATRERATFDASRITIVVV